MAALRWIPALIAGFACFASSAETIRERFTDPEDGQFDASNYLLDHRGVLPVPMVITEPAVGYGGGVALAWFSESIREAAQHSKQENARLVPPNIYVLTVFGTENGTKGGGVGGRMSFLNDTWRYRGGGAATSVNLDFYGIGGNLASGLDKIGYNLKGYFVFNEVTHRLGETNNFLGVRQLYIDLKTRFDFGTAEDAGLTPREFAKKGSSLGVTYGYDSLDNIFTTTRGVEASLDAMFYSPSLGSDTTFQSYRGHAFAYIPAAETLTVALRVDGRSVRGDVPFYQLPYIDMRGIPAARYQDENVGMTEIEGRYYVTPRWIALAFVGASRAWGRRSSFSDEGTIVSKGVGFRYMIARRLGLSIGIDIARGPTDTAFYLQVGNAWR